MAIKVLVVHVNGERTSVDPVKTGDPSAGEECQGWIHGWENHEP